MDIPLREPYGAEAYVKKQARIIMAAERMKRHEEKMASIKDQQDKQIAKLASDELMKDKKAAVLVKENTTDIKEKMQK